MAVKVKPRIISRKNGYTTRQQEEHINRQRRNGGFERLPHGETLTGRPLYELGRDSAAVRQQILWEWLPAALRLRYEKGWIGEFWYCAENSRQPGWHAAFHLPSGEPVAVRKYLLNRAFCR